MSDCVLLVPQVYLMTTWKNNSIDVFWFFLFDYINQAASKQCHADLVL